MKKSLFTLFLLSLFIGFSSCSKDSDDNEPFKWEGDIEDYNPLLGTWMSVKNPSSGLRFSEDRILYRLDYDTNGLGGLQTIEIGPFEINKSAYKTGDGITRYKLEGDKLTQYPNQNNDNNPVVLTRQK